MIDNSHLTEHGIKYLTMISKQFVLITSNLKHPAFRVKADNMHIIYQDKLNLRNALTQLKCQYGCERITIQTGGTLNAMFLREKLLDYVDVVIAPVLIGGKETSTLIDGESLTTMDDLKKLGVLQLESCETLKHSYIRLRYKVIR